MYPEDVIPPFWYVSARSYGVLVGPLGRETVARKWSEKYQGLGYETVVSKHDTPEVAECFNCGQKMNPARAGTWSNGRRECADCCRVLTNNLLRGFERLADMDDETLQITE